MRRTIMLVCSTLLLASTAGAEDPVRERALASAADDPQLDWGPCPPFMPNGCRLAVLHGDPSKANADALLEVPAGTRIAHHWHTSAERMVLIAGEMRVTYDGQEPVTLKPGTYAYGPAKLGHAAACVSRDTCVLFIAFEAPIDAMPTGRESE